jgi:transcriptional regulator with XRE-family HTH domain
MEIQMAKIKISPRPGALSELLKKKGMTQMDAFEKTRIDRKTLLKIDRGAEVKLETLQQVANKLQVTEEYFHHFPAAELTDDGGGDPEPGTIMLRKLDAARLEELLKGAQTVRWHLKAQVRDDASRKFLEEFEQAVENFRKQLKFNIPEAWDGDPSLRFQLNLLKNADDIAARLEKLADHGVALLGGNYLFWECSRDEGFHHDYGEWARDDYNSFKTVLLSVEPFGTQSRRAPIHIGKPPPLFAANQSTTVFVNGIQIPTSQEFRTSREMDDDIPF